MDISRTAYFTLIFFFNDTATTEIYTLSLHDALPIYLHSSPMKDVTNFGADILFPVLVRDIEALGIYKALGLPDSTVAKLKGPRIDIINVINLGRPIPVQDGFTGDVLTLD